MTWHHVRQAIFNIHTNVCAWCFFCTNSAVQGMGAFVPTILKEFGWTSTKAQLYSVPPYVVACCVTVALGHASDRVNKRGIFMLGSVVFSITGYFMLRFSEDVHTKYAAVFLSAIGVFAASSGFLSWGINSKLSLSLSLPRSLPLPLCMCVVCAFSFLFFSFFLESLVAQVSILILNRHQQPRCRRRCRRLHGVYWQHRRCPVDVSLPYSLLICFVRC